MYPGQLETLAIYWTSAVSLPCFNSSVLVLKMEIRNCTCSRKMLIVDILSIRYIDFQNCNYCIVGFGLILILTDNIEILSRAIANHIQ